MGTAPNQMGVGDQIDLEQPKSRELQVPEVFLAQNGHRLLEIQSDVQVELRQ